MILAFCDWLASTRISAAFGSVEWIVPAVQSLHLLLIAAVMGAVLFLGLRLLGLHGATESVPVVARRLLPVIRIAVAGLGATGTILIVAEPARELTNPAFGCKMLLLSTMVLVTLWIQRRLAHDPGRASGVLVRALGAISLIGWVGILAAGRWIAYAQAL